MSRNGSGIYSIPPGSSAVDNTIIDPVVYNTLISDLEADANTARPIVAGGTGATTAAAARANFGAQAASELVGMVAFFGHGAAPTGWLKANGAAVSRTAYASLFSVITTTYGVGDGATTFNLPDLRGEFPRGWDDGRGIDSGRALGSAQGQQARDHSHRPWSGVTNHSQQVAAGSSYFALTIGSVQNVDTSPASTLDAPNFGNETRPRNIALLACIKF